jgi:hypothetical protein
MFFFILFALFKVFSLGLMLIGIILMALVLQEVALYWKERHEMKRKKSRL